MAILIRRGTDAQWESNNSNIAQGEPAIAYDTGRFFCGTGTGTFVELSALSKADYLELALMLALAYSTSKTYVKGEFCTRSTNLYEAKQDINTAESWTSSHWTLIASSVA